MLTSVIFYPWYCIHDMVIRYGEALWPGTSPTPAKVKTQAINPQLTRGVGGWIAGHFAFAASSRVMA